MILIFLILFMIILAFSISQILVHLLNKFSLREILLYGIEISIVGLTITVLSVNSSCDNLYFYIKLLGLFIVMIGIGIFILMYKDSYTKKD